MTLTSGVTQIINLRGHGQASPAQRAISPETSIVLDALRRLDPLTVNAFGVTTHQAFVNPQLAPYLNPWRIANNQGIRPLEIVTAFGRGLQEAGITDFSIEIHGQQQQNDSFSIKFLQGNQNLHEYEFNYNGTSYRAKILAENSRNESEIEFIAKSYLALQGLLGKARTVSTIKDRLADVFLRDIRSLSPHQDFYLAKLPKRTAPVGFKTHFDRSFEGISVYETKNSYVLVISSPTRFVQVAETYGSKNLHVTWEKCPTNTPIHSSWEDSIRGTSTKKSSPKAITTDLNNLIFDAFCHQLNELSIISMEHKERTAKFSVGDSMLSRPVFILQHELGNMIRDHLDSRGTKSETISTEEFMQIVRSFIEGLRITLNESIPELKAAISLLESRYVERTANGEHVYDFVKVKLDGPEQRAAFVGDLHQNKENLERIQKWLANRRDSHNIKTIFEGDYIHADNRGKHNYFDVTETFGLIKQLLHQILRMGDVTIPMLGNHDVFSKLVRRNDGSYVNYADSFYKDKAFQGKILRNIINHLNPEYGEELQRFFDLLPWAVIVEIGDEDDQKKKRRRYVLGGHSFTDTENESDINDLAAAINNVLQSPEGKGNLPEQLKKQFGKKISWLWGDEYLKKPDMLRKLFSKVKGLFLGVFAHNRRAPHPECHRPLDEVLLLQSYYDDCAIVEVNGAGEVYIVYIGENGEELERFELYEI